MRTVSHRESQRPHSSKQLFTAKTQSTTTFLLFLLTQEETDFDSLLPSWGRVLAATGSVPLSVPLDPARVSVSFVPTDRSPILLLLVNGEPERVDEVRAKEIRSAEDLEISVDLGLAAESSKYWTCDFSYVSPSCLQSATN